MPEQITTKGNRVLPQKDYEMGEEIEPNQELLRDEEGSVKRKLEGSPKVDPQGKGKKKVKLS